MYVGTAKRLAASRLCAILSGTRLQQGNTFDGGGSRQRAEIGIDVRKIFFGENLGGVGRHLSAWSSHICDEVSKWQHRAPADTRARRAALAFIAVTLIASDFHEECLTCPGIAGWRRSCRLLRHHME